MRRPLFLPPKTVRMLACGARILLTFGKQPPKSYTFPLIYVTITKINADLTGLCT